MGIFAACQALSLVSQKSHQNHQMKMVAEVGATMITMVLIGAGTYLAGKFMDKKDKEDC